MEPCKFFYARDVGERIEDMILDCYQLAEHFGQDPDLFLNKPLSKIKSHMRWLGKLAMRKAEQQADD